MNTIRIFYSYMLLHYDINVYVCTVTLERTAMLIHLMYSSGSSWVYQCPHQREDLMHVQGYVRTCSQVSISITYSHFTYNYLLSFLFLL